MVLGACAATGPLSWCCADSYIKINWHAKDKINWHALDCDRVLLVRALSFENVRKQLE